MYIVALFALGTEQAVRGERQMIAEAISHGMELC
jgi:hypothetical protein